MRAIFLSLAAAAAIALSAGEARAWSGYGGLNFGTAAAQIKAKHSRYGKSIHPRSYYNRPVYFPPLPARSYGYGYEYEYEYYGRGYGYRR